MLNLSNANYVKVCIMVPSAYDVAVLKCAFCKIFKFFIDPPLTTHEKIKLLCVNSDIQYIKVLCLIRMVLIFNVK